MVSNMQKAEQTGLVKPISDEVDWENDPAHVRSMKLHLRAERLRGPSVIPGLTGMDLIEGTKGMEPLGHSIHDLDDARFHDAALQARVGKWLGCGATLKEIKAICKGEAIEITGNKRVLALRLAFRCVEPPAACAERKRKAAAGASSTSASDAKKRKATAASRTFPKGFRGCKSCGGTDHQRCTKHKCPQHPEYDPPKRRRPRSDSYEWPADLCVGGSDEELEEGGSGGDWSGRPGSRCEICGRRSENVGPRRGFDYANDVCGGCIEL